MDRWTGGQMNTHLLFSSFLFFFRSKHRQFAHFCRKTKQGYKVGKKEKKTVHQEAEMERGRKSDTNPNWLFDWEIICLVKLGGYRRGVDIISRRCQKRSRFVNEPIGKRSDPRGFPINVISCHSEWIK